MVFARNLRFHAAVSAAQKPRQPKKPSVSRGGHCFSLSIFYCPLALPSACSPFSGGFLAKLFSPRWRSSRGTLCEPLSARPLFGGKTQRGVVVQGRLGSVLFRPVSYRVFFRSLQMQTKNQKRYYSPQFSELATVSVRRLAWSLGKSMPYTVDHIIRLLPSVVDPSKVCLSCQDCSKCSTCIFGSLGQRKCQTTSAVSQ